MIGDIISILQNESTVTSLVPSSKIFAIQRKKGTELTAVVVDLTTPPSFPRSTEANSLTRVWRFSTPPKPTQDPPHGPQDIRHQHVGVVGPLRRGTALPEGPTICVDLCFHPCPVWRIGEWQNVPGDSGPHYQRGYLEDLEVPDGGLLSRIDHSSAMRDIKVTVVCHPQGLGTEQDLKLLLDDLSGYDVNLVRPVE